MRKTTLLSLIITIFIYYNAFSQEVKTKEAKNTLSATGAFVYITGTYTFNYERCIYTGEMGRWFINTGYGGWYFIGLNDPSKNGYILTSKTIPITFNYLAYEGNNHLELDIGVQILPNKKMHLFMAHGYYANIPKYNKSPVILMCNIGYRYQKITGGIIFRAFVGSSGIGISLGYAF